MISFGILHGDCLNLIPTLDPDSIDAIVTDPPYGLGFMGKHWDHGVPGVEFWQAALTVAKPGAHLLAFGGTRTFHRLAVAIEDAGWELRDTVMWVYGSGFPKSHDVSKAIDREAGAEREVERTIRKTPIGGGINTHEGYRRPGKVGRTTMDITAPATSEARQWQGWGTALKPAWEPILVARKPLTGTVAHNVLTHGTGGINVDGCRVKHDEQVKTTNRTASKFARTHASGQGWHGNPEAQTLASPSALGRWPANVIHDGSDEVIELFPETAPAKATARNNGEFKSVAKNRELPHVTFGHNDSGGSAARFFYCAKASTSDRDEGIEAARNPHPTVKPTDLMRYLIRLVTPPNGTVFDPFTGSGSTGKAAALEGFNFLGIEQDAEYVAIANARIAHALAQAAAQRPAPTLFDQGA